MKGIIIVVISAVVIAGLFSIFILKDEKNSVLVTSKFSQLERHSLEEDTAYSNDPYKNEVNLLKSQQYRSDTATKQEVEAFVSNLKNDVDGMKLEVAKLDDEINYQHLLEDADQEIDKVAEEMGTTKDELFQSIENAMFAPLTTEASIELDKEISATEEKKEELIKRFVGFAK